MTEDEIIGKIFEDYEVVEYVGKINPKNKTKYYKLKCVICGEEKISPKTKKDGFQMKYNHDKVCTNFKKIQEIGNTYGDFMVINYEGYKNNKKMYKVKCNICDNEKIVAIDHLKNGKGITHKSCIRNNNVQDDRFYEIWSGMRKRTTNPNCKYYNNYGGRGISSENYKYFVDFKNDMYESYLKHVEEFGEQNTTIDRIDVNGNYEKDNIRWATIKEQNRNTRKQSDRLYTGISPSGEKYEFNCVSEFAEEHNLDKNNIYNTINKIQKTHKGWSFERIK